jgi:hypothetical protein
MKHWFRRTDDDAGIGLILVIGISTVIMSMVILGGTVAERSLRSSNIHVSYNQSLGAAESGIDQTLARLQRAYVTFGADYPVPSLASAMNPTPTCAADPAGYTTPVGGFATRAAEKAWALNAISTLLAAQPDCLQRTDRGDFVVLKPSNRQVVYAQGWSPSRGASNAKTRLVKSEYLFVPYKPSNAVLTGGPLLINSSTKVTSAPGSDPVLASVHSNATITVESGNPIVYGPVSSTGDSGGASSSKFYANTGGTVIRTPAQPLPTVSALAVYNRWAVPLRDSWYDLCPNGQIKHPTSAGPCVTTAVADIVADLSPSGADYGQKVRGFTWTPAAGSDPAVWSVGKDMPDGVYYAYASNIAPATGAGNTVTANATILAQALPGGGCPKFGGTIDWDHNNINAPVIPNLFMVADADLSTSANFEAGSAGPPVVSGLFLAGDQVHMQTSSNGAFGAVIAVDQCPASTGEVNEIKNPSVYFDPNADAPFTDIINTTLWLEF